MEGTIFDVGAVPALRKETGMDIEPLRPEQVEASIFTQVIIQGWIDEIRIRKQEAGGRGYLAERHTMDRALWMLQACEKLFEAAMRGDFEYLSKASEGLENIPVSTDPESLGDIMRRVMADLSVVFDQDVGKMNAAYRAIRAIDDGTCIVSTIAPKPTQPPMNRAARRQASRGR